MMIEFRSLLTIFIGTPFSIGVLFFCLIKLKKTKGEKVSASIGKDGIKLGSGDDQQRYALDSYHECKQDDLLARMNVRISLITAGIIALLDHAISQGANGPTARIRDSLVKNTDDWQEFTAKKVVTP